MIKIFAILAGLAWGEYDINFPEKAVNLPKLNNEFRASGFSFEKVTDTSTVDGYLICENCGNQRAEIYTPGSLTIHVMDSDEARKTAITDVVNNHIP